MPSRPILILDGSQLDYRSLTLIGRAEADIVVAEEGLSRVHRARAVLEATMAAGTPVYGANTGVGAMRDVTFGLSVIDEFNAGLMRAHHFGTGDLFPADVVRAAMAIRANSALAGYTGCTEMLVTSYVDLLNRDVVPVVRRAGSIGCADIGLMGQIGAVLAGDGEAYFAGKRMSAAAALSAAGLAPITLKAKDSLAAISSNAIGYAVASHALRSAAAAVRTLLASGITLAAAMGVSSAPWEAAAAIGTPAQASVASWLAEAAKAARVPADRGVHDPLSLRMMAQVFAAAIQHLEAAARSTLATTAQSDDNPVVVGDRVLSSGGSLPLDVAIDLQSAGLALAHVARNSFNRCVLICNGRRRELPINLVAPHVAATGFGPILKLAGELFARTLSLIQPISAQSLVVADGIEDEAAFLPLVVERFERQIRALRRLAALECLLAAQAIDLMRDRPEGVVGHVYDITRAHSAFYAEDRALSCEVEAIEATLTSGETMLRLLDAAPLPSFDAFFSLDLGF